MRNKNDTLKILCGEEVIEMVGNLFLRYELK